MGAPSYPGNTWSTTPASYTPACDSCTASDIPPSPLIKQALAVQGVSGLNSTVDFWSVLQGPNPFFMVDTPLDIGCPLQPGDVVRADSVAGPIVNVTVTAARAGSCQAGTQAQLSVEQVNDMYNNFMQSFQQGVGAYAAQAGTPGGPPALPQGLPAPQPVNLPPPDPNAVTLVDTQWKAADQAELQLHQALAAIQ